jgi:hypothetical protein
MYPHKCAVQLQFTFETLRDRVLSSRAANPGAVQDAPQGKDATDTAADGT